MAKINYSREPYKKSIMEIIMENCINALFTIGLPLLINCVISKKQKSTDSDKRSSDGIMDDFKTDHDWDK